MKRRLWLIMLALCMILTAAGTALTAPAPAAAPEAVYEYDVLPDGTLEITGFTGEAAGELRLPDAIDGKRVTQIGDSAFDCCYGFTGSLVIPDSVTQIGDDAFSGCSGFTSLVIPDSVTKIGNLAFAYCSGLTSIEVAADNPNYCSIDGILYSKDGKQLIQCPRGKTGELVIPDSVTQIGDSAFRGCKGFTSLVIPDSVTEIGDEAFAYCSGFTGSLVIPDSVTEIGDYAFCGCSGFTGSLTIPDSVTEIGDEAFAYCSGFTGSLVIPDSVTQIGDYAFYGCEGLTDVYYSGTEEEWEAISIGDGNEPLLNAKIHYNSRGPDSETVVNAIDGRITTGEQDQDKPAQPQHAPQRGDSGNILLWVLLAVLSLGGGVLAFILFKRRRA